MTVLLVLAIGYCLWPVPVRAAPDDAYDPMALLPATTKAKLWWLAGATLSFLFFLGFTLPALNRDRGLATLYTHLLMPYSAAWDAMRLEYRSGAGLLLLLQIVGYPVIAGYFWIRNRLGTAMLALVILHSAGAGILRSRSGRPTLAQPVTTQYRIIKIRDRISLTSR